jgi:hypothetical protein
MTGQSTYGYRRGGAVFAPPRITPTSTREYGKTYADGGPVTMPQPAQLAQLPPRPQLPRFPWRPVPGGGIVYD